MSPSECVIHIDFSENFSGKFGSEIQSVHFGVSHKQVTLHTGVLYAGDVEQPIPFCTLPPSKRHDPTTIWKYLDYMKESHRNIEVLHFFRYGPTTQYWQKSTSFCSVRRSSTLATKQAIGTSGRLVMAKALSRRHRRGHQTKGRQIDQSMERHPRRSYSVPSSDPGNVSEVILCRGR